MSFHTHDNWTWTRLEDGSVRVSSPTGEHTMTADSWASVISSVSAGGESDGRFYSARDWHDSTGAVCVMWDANRSGPQRLAAIREVIDWLNARPITALHPRHLADEIFNKWLSCRLAP